MHFRHLRISHLPLIALLAVVRSVEVVVGPLDLAVSLEFALLVVVGHGPCFLSV